MKKLIVVTQQVDPASAVLGATVPKLRALAERVEELVVLTDSAAEGALPDNVAIRTFSASRRARRGMRFESALARELSRRPRPSAVLAHMCPIYAVLAAPLARPTGVKVLLWFTHWRRSSAALDGDPRLVEGPERRRRGPFRSRPASSSRSATGSTSPTYPA